MEQNQPIQQSNKQERYELKRQRKLDEQVQAARKKLATKILKIVFIVLFVGGVGGWLVWFIVNQPKIPESEIISRQGIHWHTELAIFIKGQKQEIPADIGIGAIHQPIHTHDATGVIHLEFSGLVKKEDTALGQFFKNWEKQFNSNCIFEFCNGAEGALKMSINGQENKEFENYFMKDGDKIEIHYD